MFSKAERISRRPSWLARLARKPRDRDALLPLYEAVVGTGRDPFWYRDGRVPDTVDGRFDMIAAVTAILLVHLESCDGEDAKNVSVMLTELFIDDMDESLRQIGIGDYVVGKHIGRMVGALGGRLAAFREARSSGDYLPAVRRNIYHEQPPSEELARRSADRLGRFAAALGAVPLAQLRQGGLPVT